MKPIRLATVLCVTALTASLSVPATGQGLYVGPVERSDTRPTPIPRFDRPTMLGQVRLTSMQIKARIQDGVATTELHQVFRNEGSRIAEGIWILPLPKGATADRFTMTMGGKQVAGEVLDARKARGIYEGIVRRQRDPGLLEYLGNGCLRARVFPIPAKGEIKVVVRYSQVLTSTAGLYEWSFPLRAAGVAGRMAEKVSLDLQIRSRTPLKNIYSPLAGLDIVRKGDHEARASLELTRGQVPQRDLVVHYGLSDQDFGLNLLTWRKKNQPGFFMMMLSPKRDWPEPENVHRVIHFVLDTSGSMAGEKIQQARKALRSFLLSLDDGDFFNVVPFSTEARPFFSGPIAASKENVERALAMAADLEARGGTNIEDGLDNALQSDFERSSGQTYIPITVFLTDGLPTVGTTDVERLIAQVKKANEHKARIFVFGVGDDVNTKLLDTIAEDSRGDRDYVRPGEDIEVKTGALFTKLSGPVMTDLELVSDGIDGFDVFPRSTPDLFQGSTLLFVGRYRGEGHHAIRLKGNVNGSEREYVYEGSFPGSDRTHDFLPTLWAQRKVAVMLDAIRLNGANKELLDEVERLGKTYGIVTPYTSHLILEEGMSIARDRGVDRPETAGERLFFGMADDESRVVRELQRAGGWGGRMDRDGLKDLAGAARAESEMARRKLGRLAELQVGKAAVDNSVVLGGMLSSPSLQGAGNSNAGLTQQRVQGTNFFLVQGVWVDQAYKADMVDRIHKVEAFSDAYFALLKERPELARFFAFSSRILVVLGDRVIEVE